MQKGDHPGDFHVHVYYNEGNSRKLLGKYRIPGLEPLPGTKYELNNGEHAHLKEWLDKPEQIKKLEDCAKSTVFNLNAIAKSALPDEIAVEHKEGETFIIVRVPITRRINSR